MCAKCELKETSKCRTVVVVKGGDEEVTYYLQDNGAKESYHENVCGSGKREAAVTGVVTEKEGKKWLTPSKVVYAKWRSLRRLGAPPPRGGGASKWSASAVSISPAILAWFGRCDPERRGCASIRRRFDIQNSSKTDGETAARCCRGLSCRFGPGSTKPAGNRREWLFSPKGALT